MSNRTTELVRQALDKGLKLLFPPQCATCGRLGWSLCPRCVAEFYELGARVCPICGDLREDRTVCPRCEVQRPHYDQLRSAFRFQGTLRDATHALKYEGRSDLGLSLALAMARVLPPIQADLIVPIPLHQDRLVQRGYNQAECLSQALADLWVLPHADTDALIRVRHTETQVNLTFQERQQNVADAFSASEDWVANRSVILVDDVSTTGATLNEAAAALRAAGAIQIFGITLARAV
ncbi:MAG: ComF family protein [Chloroflexi bacterium]|nr:ComF family protein [Chloroflexota bacterium]